MEIDQLTGMNAYCLDISVSRLFNTCNCLKIYYLRVAVSLGAPFREIGCGHEQTQRIRAQGRSEWLGFT